MNPPSPESRLLSVSFAAPADQVSQPMSADHERRSHMPDPPTDNVAALADPISQIISEDREMSSQTRDSTNEIAAPANQVSQPISADREIKSDMPNTPTETPEDQISQPMSADPELRLQTPYSPTETRIVYWNHRCTSEESNEDSPRPSTSQYRPSRKENRPRSILKQVRRDTHNLFERNPAIEVPDPATEDAVYIISNDNGMYRCRRRKPVNPRQDVFIEPPHGSQEQPNKNICSKCERQNESQRKQENKEKIQSLQGSEGRRQSHPRRDHLGPTTSADRSIQRRSRLQTCNLRSGLMSHGRINKKRSQRENSSNLRSMLPSHSRLRTSLQVHSHSRLHSRLSAEGYQSRMPHHRREHIGRVNRLNNHHQTPADRYRYLRRRELRNFYRQRKAQKKYKEEQKKQFLKKIQK